MGKKRRIKVSQARLIELGKDVFWIAETVEAAVKHFRIYPKGIDVEFFNVPGRGPGHHTGEDIGVELGGLSLQVVTDERQSIGRVVEAAAWEVSYYEPEWYDYTGIVGGEHKILGNYFDSPRAAGAAISALFDVNLINWVGRRGPMKHWKYWSDEMD